jgi:anthranilate synthase component 1
MEPYNLKVIYKKMLADTATPVSIYLRLRDVFPNSLLLESSDYHSRENSMSYICCDPIAGIKLENETLKKYYPDGKKETLNRGEFVLVDEISQFQSAFKTDADTSQKFITDGFFGYLFEEGRKRFAENPYNAVSYL